MGLVVALSESAVVGSCGRREFESDCESVCVVLESSESRRQHTLTYAHKNKKQFLYRIRERKVQIKLVFIF